MKSLEQCSNEQNLVICIDNQPISINTCNQSNQSNNQNVQAENLTLNNTKTHVKSDTK